VLLVRHNIYDKFIKMSAQTEMKVISVLLDEAMAEGLEVEVIYSALKTMREDDSVTPAQAFQEAMSEWVK
jgi:predicted RNA methylase